MLLFNVFLVRVREKNKCCSVGQIIARSPIGHNFNSLEAYCGSFQNSVKSGSEKKLLSRDCDGCPQMKSCKIRFFPVIKGELVHCPDGTRHLVDS